MGKNETQPGCFSVAGGVVLIATVALTLIGAAFGAIAAVTS